MTEEADLSQTYRPCMWCVPRTVDFSEFRQVQFMHSIIRIERNLNKIDKNVRNISKILEINRSVLRR